MLVFHGFRAWILLIPHLVLSGFFEVLVLGAIAIPAECLSSDNPIGEIVVTRCQSLLYPPG